MSKENNSNIAEVLSGIAAIITAICGIYIALKDNSAPPTPTSIATPGQASAPTPIPKTIPLGWIRIGAVDNTLGIAPTGETLIATSQPVTIAPVKVPKINSSVVVITGVNLRSDYPKPPGYDLHEKISVLTPNQKLVILEVQAFVDSDSPTYTTVWAKVGAP
ncbi:MAG: hypothetical protein F6K31_41370 [Symploca sp. SIO2G7]|nr:hypothetical protein [Symploca sp. SIO2G7]